ncbi:MAG TPA: chemotaxis protein CheB [Flavisolibacter sp.]|jgi:two-component system chemotaxis response regulator CheB|nr:chemotaxis protein CheB [Flavisolibacter sp.]
MAEKPLAYRLLVIGGSAGSLEAILQFFPSLMPEKALAIVLVLHRRSGESMLTELLKDKTSWQVKEAEEKEPIEPGTIYIAPADYHLLIENDHTFSLDYSEKIHYSRPAIDVTFETAAEAYGPRLMALLLSGANQDGTAGLQKIKRAGGFVMVQDPGEAIVSYMPKYAVDHVSVDRMLPAKEIAAAVRSLMNGVE